MMLSSLIVFQKFVISIISFILAPNLSGGVFTKEVETEIRIQEFPYLGQIEINFDHLCSAAIIHPQVLITAGNCLEGGNIIDAIVRVGSSLSRIGGQTLKIKKVLNHEYFDWNRSPFCFDLGLVLLDGKIDLNENASVIKIAHGEPAPGTLGSVVGYDVPYSFWSMPVETLTYGSQLTALQVPIAYKMECERTYEKLDLEDDQICGKINLMGHNIYYHDAGSPLVVRKKLVGIVSFGSGFRRPIIFTNLVKHRHWIVDALDTLVANA